MPPKAKDRQKPAQPAPPPVQAQSLDDQGDGDQDEPQHDQAEDELKPEHKGHDVLERWRSELNEAKEALTALNLSTEQTQALIAKITTIKAKYEAFNVTLDLPVEQAGKSSVPSGHKMNTSNLPPFPEATGNPSNHIRELKTFFQNSSNSQRMVVQLPFRKRPHHLKISRKHFGGLDGSTARMGRSLGTVHRFFLPAPAKSSSSG
jgi:hypothetical protein